MGVTRNVPSEGGSGGKRGHSSMEHTDYTGSIKTAARSARRRDDRLTIAEQLRDIDAPHELAEPS